MTRGHKDQTRISCSAGMKNGEEPITPEICFHLKPEGLWGIHTTTNWTHFYKQFSFTTFIVSKNPFCQNSPKPPAQPSSCMTLQKQFSRHLPQSKIHPSFAGVRNRAQRWNCMPTVIQLSQQQSQSRTCISWLPNPQLSQESHCILSGLVQYLWSTTFCTKSPLFSFPPYYKSLNDVLDSYHETGFSPNFISKLLFPTHLSLQFGCTTSPVWLSGINFFFPVY